VLLIKHGIDISIEPRSGNVGRTKRYAGITSKTIILKLQSSNKKCSFIKEMINNVRESIASIAQTSNTSESFCYDLIYIIYKYTLF
jgi:hypothetical protein